MLSVRLKVHRSLSIRWHSNASFCAAGRASSGPSNLKINPAVRVASLFILQHLQMAFFTTPFRPPLKG